MPQMTELHPLQDEDTIQGVLEILYKLDLFCREISGMDKFTFQPGGGSAAIYLHSCVLRSYYKAIGELDQRDEIITTMFSHPANCAAPKTAGFKVIVIMPDANGYPDLDTLKAACSERTAGLFITNPEDTGIYNPKIDEFVNAVHTVGGLCFYDQADLNGIIGIARAKEAGFDACHFNLHKTFSAPHGSWGPASGGYGVRDFLIKYLPVPIVSFDDYKYYLDYEQPCSVGKIREFLGNVEVALKAYAWIMAMGAEGLTEVASTAVINTNYLVKLLQDIPGVEIPYTKAKFRSENVRISWEKLKRETGCTAEEVRNRMVDFGLQSPATSQHPWIVPEPFTLEPTETYSKADIEYWAMVCRHVAQEAYDNPDILKSAPHNAPIHKIREDTLDDPRRWAATWRSYLRKKKQQDICGK